MSDPLCGADQTNFAMMPAWVLHHPSVTPTVAYIYAMLAMYGEDNGRSTAALVEATGLGKTAVYAAVRVLISMGALKKKPDGRLSIPKDPTDSATAEKPRSRRVKPRSGSAPAETAALPLDSAPAETDSAHPENLSAVAECTVLIDSYRPSSDKSPPPTGVEVARRNLDAAHALTEFAWTQPVKPVIAAGRSGSDFCAVRALIEAHLDAGESAADIRAAIKTGGISWTKPALGLAIARAKEATNGRNGHGMSVGDRNVARLMALRQDATTGTGVAR